MRHKNSVGRILVALAITLIVIGVPLPGLLQPKHIMTNTRGHASTERQLASYGKLPLSFEPNQGQADPQVDFLSRGHGYNLLLTSTAAVLTLWTPVGRAISQSGRDQTMKESVLRMQLVGANPQPRVAGLQELPGKINYFIGNNPAKWRTNIPSYAQVSYQDVYPGINLVYYSNQQQLEYDIVVAPGADPTLIRLGFQGVERVEVVAQGDLVLHTASGEIRQHKPRIYQEKNGVKQEISGGYILKGKHQVGFQVASYDSSKPLVIDPVLVYSTYLGGGGGDVGFGIAVDSGGNTYVTGLTNSFNFATSGAYQPTVHGIVDAFVAKLDASGSRLVYFTYLGGTDDDRSEGIAIDAAGNAYVTGSTLSSDFPTTPSAVQPGFSGGGTSGDAFVAKLNATGTRLLYSTYLGGSNDDQGSGIAVDNAGHAYVTGSTLSTNFRTTPGVFQSTFGGNSLFGVGDAFVAELDTTAIGVPSLIYSTYLGGNGSDSGDAIAVDSSGNAYVTGATFSSNFPTTSGTLQRGSALDAFVTKLNATGATLLYSTYLGGNSTDLSNAIAVDNSGNAYITGKTLSINFPIMPGAFQRILGSSNGDAFVTKLNTIAAGGSSLVYSSYLGGNQNESGNAIAVDMRGNAYVTGFTLSINFPSPGAIQNLYGGGGCSQPGINQPGPSPISLGFRGCGDAFVTIVNATGSSLLSSTYLGGNQDESGNAIALDGRGNAYVTGFTYSDNFPFTPGVFQTDFRDGLNDAFVVKLGFASDMMLTSQVSPSQVTVFNNLTYTLTITNNGPDVATGVTLTDPLPAGTTFVSATSTQGSCAESGGTLICSLGSLAAGSRATVILVITPTVAGTLTNTPTVTSDETDPITANNTAAQSTMVLADTTPPTTTAAVMPTPTSFGWNNSTVTVNLSAVDDLGGSGVQAIHFTLSGAQTSGGVVAGSSVAVTISVEGISTLTYFAQDRAGNQEMAKTLTIRIDETPPTVTYSRHARVYTVDQRVNISCVAADSLSGIATTTCRSIRGPAYLFKLGLNTFSATATDQAGNIGSGTTSFTVRVTYASLCKLTKRFVKKNRVADRLCAKLREAERAAKHGHLQAKAHALAAYRRMVRTQRGKTLTNAQIAILIRLAGAL